MDKKKSIKRFLMLVMVLVLQMQIAAAPLPDSAAQADNPNPPDNPVKLIFIHHSTGENWLVDDNGGLGKALEKNNYFVSDTNYKWGPDAIGDRTDIYNWVEWFRGPNTETIMKALLNENGQHSNYARTLADPGGENEIILFKSCFPNSKIRGNPGDPPTSEMDWSVGYYKYVYNDILKYFATRPDKLFVVITAPPLSDGEYAANARGLNQWLVNDWLNENQYTQNNVAVFDFYNILTGPNNHHRYVDGKIEHVFVEGGDTSYYPTASGDDHPSHEGNLKATEEFVPMLNIFYHRWKGDEAPAAPEAESVTVTPESDVATEAPVVPSAATQTEPAAPPTTAAAAPTVSSIPAATTGAGKPGNQLPCASAFALPAAAAVVVFWRRSRRTGI